MIKTMLLTAQLALSPIVGTNGLQPKRLPNPVYGETTDYSVTYQGETYTRIFYGKYFATNIDPEAGAGEIYIGGKGSTTPVGEMVSDNLEWTDETNIGKAGTEYFLYWQNGEYDSCYFDQGRWAISFWLQSANYLYYQEIFIWQQEDETSLEHLEWWAWDYNGTEYTQDDHATGEITNLPFGYSFYTKKPTEKETPFYENHSIPFEQPKTANPSVYDNIYNFYYDNLFANEALDELGAEVGNNSLTMRQWLAHTATIVSISLLACALVVLVIKIFKLIAGSISDIWG